MADDTHPSASDLPRGPWVDGWIEAICPDPVSDQLGELLAEGDVLLAWATTWAEAVHDALDRYEAAVSDAYLADDLHAALATVTGADPLHRQLDQLARCTEQAY